MLAPRFPSRRAKAALGRSERKEELQKMLTSLGIRL